ncbi:UNC93-like protein 3 [Camellia lanceoleosa]|uniref:UNC93-like protein 3 n=1 Tax=Camellia lanceoleosa TaxID=1840588 RepID=A0ACC0GWM2_9ERIC|nr:UNC93-like protein 3 [Camellia lanceoleosa]
MEARRGEAAVRQGEVAKERGDGGKERRGSGETRGSVECTKNIVKLALGVSSVGGAMTVYGAAYGAIDAICSLAVGWLTSGLKSVTLIIYAGAFIQIIILI